MMLNWLLLGMKDNGEALVLSSWIVSRPPYKILLIIRKCTKYDKKEIHTFKLNGQFDNVNILDNHRKKLSNIRAVYYDPYNECVNKRIEIDGISLLVRPLTQNNYPKAQLCDPIEYQELNDDYNNCILFSIVAWDHVSWPGNDFYIGARMTDDGVKAAATNVMECITGVSGRYDAKSNRYNPPSEFSNWEQVVIKNQLVFGQEADVYVY